MHLSVLFVASEQHIGRCLEGKFTNGIPVDDGGMWCVGLSLGRGRHRRLLHLGISDT